MRIRHYTYLQHKPHFLTGFIFFKACLILVFFLFFTFAVRKPVPIGSTTSATSPSTNSTISLTNNTNNTTPQIVHPPHLYNNAAATVIHQQTNPPVRTGSMGEIRTPHGNEMGVRIGGHGGEPHPPQQAYQHSSETATYVNVVSPAAANISRPPFYHQPPPMMRPQVQPHPGSGGHVPYSPAFQHHPHVRPVGIAIPRQGNTNPETYHRQSSIGKLTFFAYSYSVLLVELFLSDFFLFC